MKKVIIIAGITSLIFGACTNTKLATYKDDVYASPTEDKLERQRIAAEKQKREEEEARKDAEERAREEAAQKAKDDANPYYKTPDYDKDDYYDYEYASRIRRFNDPVYGLGYYDNYYTNYYWYNGNPACYGTSIYNSYNYWGPSYGCAPYGSGWSVSIGYNYGYGYPYGYGSPYGYGYPYGYNPYYNNAYWNGYYNGYNNGYYNGAYGYPYGYNYGYPNYGWGYYNSFDVNSGYGKVTYAPRTSHDGGNASRTSHPGVKVDENGYALKYLQGVKSAQETTPKFDPQGRALRNIKRNDNSFSPAGTNPTMINDGSNNPRTVTYPSSGGNNSNPRANKVDNGIKPGSGNNSNNNNAGENDGPGFIRTNRGDKNTQQSEPIKSNQPIKVNNNPRNNNSPEEVKPNFNFNNSPSDSPSNQPSNPGSRGGSNSGNSGGRPR